MRWVAECGVQISIEVFRTLNTALSANKVLLALETTDRVRTATQIATAESRFEQLVLPEACVTGLADELTSGQYTLLEQYLADEFCSFELMRSLGLCGKVVCAVS